METFSALMALCVGNSPVTDEFPSEASDAEIWFLSAPEQTAEQTIDTPVIWGAIAIIMTSLQLTLKSWKNCKYYGYIYSNYNCI